MKAINIRRLKEKQSVFLKDAMNKTYIVDEWGVRYSADWKTLIGADSEAFQCEHYRIRDGVTHIEPNAFHQCHSLKSLWMPDSVTAVGGSLCEGCWNLEKANVSANLRHPDIAMFCGCTSLQEVVLPEGVESIGENMFTGCRSLKNITIPSTVKHFRSDTFRNSAIEEIVLPDGLESIGCDTFIGCTSLKRLTIPHNVKEVGPWLVQAHKEFEGLVCHSPHFRIDNDSLISIRNNELIACWTRKTVYHISGSVKKVGSICNDIVETIIIDTPLEMIGRDAFVCCKSLRQIVYRAPVAHADTSHGCEHINGVPQQSW